MKFRKKTAALLSAAILIGSTAVPAAAEDYSTETIALGDIDRDGDITLRDAILLARTNADLVWLSGNARIAADIDGNGTLDSNDLTLLLRHLCGKDTVLGEKENTVMLNKSKDLMENIRKDESIAANRASDYRAGQLAFSVDMLQRLCEKNEDGSNIMISPLSMELALSMTANGAKGQTQEEMLKLLGGSLTMEELNASHLWLTDQLTNSSKRNPLNIANAIWIKNNAAQIHVPESFLQTNADYYQAGAYLAPFDDLTVKDINEWVKAKTDGMIPKVLKQLDPSNVMVLVNALCFDAEWQKQYEDYQVHDGSFTKDDGTEQTVQMMWGGDGRYIESENASGFIKQYKDCDYSFAAILPKEGMTVREYIDSLDAEALDQILGSSKNMGDYDLYTRLPQFEFDYSTSLKETLSEAGMPTAFQNKIADFSALNDLPDAPTSIGDVIHKTHIELTQSGTRAAAVTAVIMEAGASCPPEYEKKVYEVYLDRPFVFMILHEGTQMPIFIGVVNDISES